MGLGPRVPPQEMVHPAESKRDAAIEIVKQVRGKDPRGEEKPTRFQEEGVKPMIDNNDGCYQKRNDDKQGGPENRQKEQRQR